MGNPTAEAFIEDDYFAEPDYDNFTDEELDEMYHFGQLLKKPSGTHPFSSGLSNRVHESRESDEFSELELEFDDYIDSDIYDDI